MPLSLIYFAIKLLIVHFIVLFSKALLIPALYAMFIISWFILRHIELHEIKEGNMV